MKVNGGADIHLHPVEDPTPEQMNAQRKLPPVESPSWSRLLAGPVGPWGSHPGAICSCRTARCGKDPRWSKS